MIPADVASNLRTQLPDIRTPSGVTQGIQPTQKIADVLSGLAPGQRILAEIQALLPNGAYRAVVAQRDLTLALPFSAKAGDTIELEVQENDGKLTLAFVANRGNSAQAEAQGGQESVPTRLSQTGQLIGDLLSGIDEPGQKAPPAPLNGNRPLLGDTPPTGSLLSPLLKQALTESGMFYEAHQARWVEGRLPADQLLREPQGQLSRPSTIAAADQGGQTPPSAPTVNDSSANDARVPNRSAPDNAPPTTTQTIRGIAPELVPLVQQQLDALASQTYAWQGQVWPGQEMWWEIGKEPNQRQADDPSGRHWQTRLKLELPTLGGLDITLRLLPGNALEIQASTPSEDTERTLSGESEGLRSQFAAAGLNLSALTVRHVNDETP